MNYDEIGEKIRHIRETELKKTREELLLKKEDSKKREKIRRKIDYILNVVSEDELEYIYVNISQFIKFTHKNEVKTLKEIKQENKN